MLIIVSEYIICFSKETQDSVINLKGNGILNPSMWMGVPNVSGSSGVTFLVIFFLL